METKDLVPVIAVGGALGLIVYLASKNQNKADEVYMPYGWGSFQNSKNPVTPITPAPPTPKPPEQKGWIEPWNSPPWNGDWQNYIKWNGNWEAYQEWLRQQQREIAPTKNSPPIPVIPINAIPVVGKSMDTFKPLPIKSSQLVIKPVTGKKVAI